MKTPDTIERSKSPGLPAGLPAGALFAKRAGKEKII